MAVVEFTLINRGSYADNQEFGRFGAYEQIDAELTFAVDPNDKRNSAIIDLELAPRDADGRVRFKADFSIVQPRNLQLSNQRIWVELPNRGRRRFVPVLNQAPHDAVVSREAHPGDGFLFEQGFSVASIGWQWDVNRSDSMMGLEAPLAHENGTAVDGTTCVEFRPSEAVDTFLLADRVHRPLPAADTEQADAMLLVRDFEDGEDTLIPRDQWAFAKREGDSVVASNNHVLLADGVSPGKIYHVVYRTDRAPVAGTGLLALREVGEFLRKPSELNPTGGEHSALYAFGVSQTGRMQRHFLNLGLNEAEDGSPVYDGFLIHVAGARRGSFNHRFAQPSNQTMPLWGHAFPFADIPTQDVLSAKQGGLLDRQIECGGLPKIISTDTAAEYWRGDASLAHIDTGATIDLESLPNARRYLFAGTQHMSGYPGQSRHNDGVKTTARYPLNLVDYRPLLRAAVINLDQWVTNGVEPPQSRHPRLDDRSAVERKQVLEFFATIPGFEVPASDRLPFVRVVDMGAEESIGVARFPAVEGAFYPALVSAVDSNGNEVAGVRLPDVSVPIGSHAGFNPRDPITGSEDQIVPMNGCTMLFASTAEERSRTGDPRPAISERYKNKEDYLSQVRAAAIELVEQRYLRAEDLETVVENARARYEFAIDANTLSNAAD